MILINLLPHREEKRQQRKRAFFAGMMLAGLVGVGVVGAWYTVLQQMTAAQVSRPQGSAMMFSCGSCGATSRTAATCFSFVRMSMFSKGTNPSSRAMVWASSVPVSKRSSSCFGL